MPLELVETVYTTEASAAGGRTGRVRSADGVLDLELGKPGSQANPKANPETLFAAAYAACFQGTLLKRASEQGLQTQDCIVTAVVDFGKAEEGGFGIAVELKASIPGADQATVEDLMRQAHQTCPYSRATRGNVNVVLIAV
jgi:osmotically inducible protein OsmC